MTAPAGRTDVAVVGGTLTGLATALGLARRGVAVTLLDTVPAPRLSWTAVHHWSVLPVLDRLGVLDRALLEGEATAHWGLRVLATGEQLVYDVRELGREVGLPFNLRLEPAVLRGLLQDALLACPDAQVVDGVRLDAVRQDGAGAELLLAGDGVGVALDSGVLRARWVVGADGHASAVRRHTGLAFEGTTWTERGVVALVRHDFGARSYPETTFQVDGRFGAVVERAGCRRWRYLFQESLSQREGEVEQRIAGVLHAVTGERSEVLGWSAARMHQRSATSYRAGRVLLVGDAAHVTHPMCGHTSLSGWFDADSLVPVLHRALEGGPDGHLTQWAELRRRQFLDEAVPASLRRRHLVAQIHDAHRLEVELEAFRRATVDPAYLREALLAERDALLPGMPSAPPF